MSVNWSLGLSPDIGGNAFNSFLKGQEARKEQDTQNALARILTGGQVPGQKPNPLAAGIPQPGTIGGQMRADGIGGGLGANAPDAQPDMSGDWAILAKNNPQMFMQLQQQQRAQAAAQAKAQQEQFATAAKLLEGVTDEATYRQRLGAARQMGIDVSRVPQNYDPQWVQQTTQMFRLLSDKPDSISGIARELQDAGYKPGTPEFEQAMRDVISSKYASDYVDEQGNTRRRSVLSFGAPQAAPMAAPQAQQGGPELTFEQVQGAVNGLGREGAAGWLQRNGYRVRVSTPQQARSLPSGTRIILPDGSEGVVP